VLSKITTVLSTLIFGCASSALAGSHTRSDYYDLGASRHAVFAALSSDRAGVLGRTRGPVIAEENRRTDCPSVPCDRRQHVGLDQADRTRRRIDSH
jgi:hypothetical protein